MPTTYDQAVLLTAQEYTTLADLYNKLGPDFNRQKVLLNEFETSLSLLSMLPVYVANGRFEDEQLYIEPWQYDAHSNLGDLNSGAKFSNLGTYKRKEMIAMREGACGISEKEYKAQGSVGNLWRMRQNAEKMKFIMLDMEHDVFYGDPRKDPRSFLGLGPRHSIITDMDGIIQNGEHKGELSPYITLDAGGTTAGSLASMFLIYPSNTNGINWMIPGSETDFTGGIEFHEGMFTDHAYVENGQAVTKRQAIDSFNCWGGVASKNRHASIRIANIDISSAEGYKKFVYKIFEATEAVAPEIAANFIGFVPKRLKTEIMKREYDRPDPIQFQGDRTPKAIASRDIVVAGTRIRSITHLTSAEDKLA